MKIECQDKIDIRLINPDFVKTRLNDKNDIDKPMIISAERAAKYIAKALDSKKFEIQFPKKYSIAIKFFSFLLFFSLQNPYKNFILIYI